MFTRKIKQKLTRQQEIKSFIKRIANLSYEDIHYCHNYCGEAGNGDCNCAASSLQELNNEAQELIKDRRKK